MRITKNAENINKGEKDYEKKQYGEESSCYDGGNDGVNGLREAGNFGSGR